MAYPPCNQARRALCRNRDMDPRETFRNIVKKCVEDNVEDESEMKNSDLVRKVKKCIYVNNQDKEDDEESEDLQEVLQERVDRRIEETSKLANNMVQEVEDYMKEKDVKKRNGLPKI